MRILSRKRQIIQHYLWSLPFLGYLAFVIIVSLFDVPDGEMVHVFFAFVVLYTPAILFALITRNIGQAFHAYTGVLPDPLIVKFASLETKINALFYGMCTLIFAPISVFCHFLGNVGVSRLLILVSCLSIIFFFKHARRLKNPFIVSLSSREIINRNKKAYSWDNVEYAEIFDEGILLDVDDGESYDDIFVFNYEVDHSDYCRAVAYIKKYVKPENVEVNLKRMPRRIKAQSASQQARQVLEHVATFKIEVTSLCKLYQIKIYEWVC